MEIVLADGDIVRTGQFAVSNSQSSHISKFTFGPSIEGLFLQTNLGVVTKMGIWLYPQPPAYASCVLDVPELEDVEHVVDLFNEFRQNGVIPNTVYVPNIVEWTAMMGKRKEFWPNPGPIPLWRIRELQKQFDLGYWTAKFGLYGPAEVVQAHVNEVKRVVVKRIPVARFRSRFFSGKDGELLKATDVPEEDGGFFVGIPSLWSLPMVKFRLPKDGSGIASHIDFSPIIPSSGKAVVEWAKAAQKIYEENGYDLFCDFFMHERHVIFVNMMTFDKTNPVHRTAVDRIFRDLAKAGKERGYSAYRTHVNYMGKFSQSLGGIRADRELDLISDFYDFNNHAYRRFVEKIKVHRNYLDGPHDHHDC
jgi:hypothetical protein